VVTASSTPILNLANCLSRCQVDIEDIIIAPFASAMACLTADEMALGAIIIDMGGSTTSFAIFQSGDIVFTGGVPLGGGHVTSDIAMMLATNITVAERIKTLYGNAYVNLTDKDAMIDVEAIDNDGYQKEPNYISKTYLSNIIQPRLEEIFELIHEQIHASGYDKLINNRIILTGGASQILGLKELATQIFNKPTRIARPLDIEGLHDHNNNAYACAIGILKFVANRPNYGINYQDKTILGQNNFIKKIINWFQENF
jgi:cell division protein FtsA